MEKNVYILYMGDAWLSNASLVVMGVFSSEENAIESIDTDLGYSINELDDIKESLRKMGSTQGLDNNWMIVKCTLDEFGEV